MTQVPLPITPEDARIFVKTRIEAKPLTQERISEAMNSGRVEIEWGAAGADGHLLYLQSREVPYIIQISSRPHSLESYGVTFCHEMSHLLHERGLDGSGHSVPGRRGDDSVIEDMIETEAIRFYHSNKEFVNGILRRPIFNSPFNGTRSTSEASP